MRATSNSDEQVLIGEHREPLWPKKLIGSISHSGQTSIAAVKPKQTPKSGFGIDMQSIIDSETQAKISPTIISRDEYVLIKKRVNKLSETMLFTLVFSAKESFFKALFNKVGEYFNFGVVSVVNIDILKQQLTLKIIDTLNNQLPQHFEIDVPFAILESNVPKVITVCNWEL